MKISSLMLLVMAVATVLSAQPWQQDNRVFNPSGIPSFTFSQPRFADLDADGDFDFLLGGSNSAPIYIKNTGNAGSPQFTIGENITGGITTLNAEMAVCVDIDGDGDLDIVTGGYTGLHLYLNSGTPAIPVFSEQPGFFSALTVGNYPIPDLADIDGDGDPDLLVGLSEDGAVRLYTNIGTPTAAQFSNAAMQIIGDVGLYAYPVFCDLDADGDQDILCGRDSHGFVYYQNNGDAANPLWQTNSALFAGLGNTTYWNSPDLVDLTGDGLADLVFGTADGPLVYYVNTGTNANPVWQANTTLFGGVIDVGGASSPVFFDFDGDGDLDLISGSQLGYIKYYENTGTIHAPAWSENSAYFASIDHSIYAAVAVGNLDDDDLPDAIVGDLSGNLFYHRNTGTGFMEQTGILPPISLGGWSVPRLIDMNGDGHLDLIVGNEAGNLYYYVNNGTSPVPSWTHIPNYFSGLDVGSHCSPCLGDIDGDGDIDVLAGNIQGNLLCWLREGHSWVLNSTIFSGISTNQNAAPALVDLDHDGDLDLVLGDYDGTFSYWRNLMYSGAVLNPPQNIQVEFGDVSTVSWDAPAAGSTSPLEGYRTYVDGVFNHQSPEQYVDLNLQSGSSYIVSVTALYTAGESAPATLEIIVPALNPPQNIQVDYGDPVTVSWSPPEPGNGATFEHYNIYINGAYFAASNETFLIMNPEPGVQYIVEVTAQYTEGESAPATIVVFVVPVGDQNEVPAPLAIAPNPCIGGTTISFGLKAGETGVLEIFNLKGQRVRAWPDLNSGHHALVWDCRDIQGQKVASGIYLCRLTRPESSQSKRLILVN